MFIRQHLPVLLNSCLAIEPDLEMLAADYKFLNRFYIDTRYPVHWPSEYTKEEALKAKTAVENIRDRIEDVLKHTPR